MPVIHPSLGIAELFAGGVGDTVQVGAGPGAQAAEGGVCISVGEEAVRGGEGGNGAEGVGMEDSAGAGFAVDEEEAFDGLVDAGAVDPGVSDTVGGVQFEQDVGPVVDEALGEAVVERLAQTVAFAVEFVGEHAAVDVGQGSHAAGEVVGEGAGLAVDDVMGLTQKL